MGRARGSITGDGKELTSFVKALHRHRPLIGLALVEAIQRNASLATVDSEPPRERIRTDRERHKPGSTGKKWGGMGVFQSPCGYVIGPRKFPQGFRRSRPYGGCTGICLHRTPEGPTPVELWRDWIQGALKRPR